MRDYDLPRARAGQRLDGRVRALTPERLEAPSIAAPRGPVVLGGTG